MNVTVETLYFNGAEVENSKKSTVQDSRRGYPVTHLLCMHLTRSPVSDTLDFYFSTERVQVEGRFLNRLLDSLAKGEPLLSETETFGSFQITKITVLPYT